MRIGRLLIAALICAAAFTVHGHGFAQRYDLPVPLTLYITGAAMTVILSFVVISIFAGRHRPVGDYPRFNLLSTPPGRFLAHPFMIAVLRFLGLAAFLLVIATGLIGDPDPFKNIAPTAVWVIWWVGLAYVSALIGDLWALLNPWKTVYSLAEVLAAKFCPGLRVGLHIAYPKWLGDWPAVLLFLCFIWAELAWPASDVPTSLANAVIIYSLITWTGMFVFGPYTWLRHGEAFSLAFGLLARFSLSEVRINGLEQCAHCSDGNCSEGRAACRNCHECFENAGQDVREWNLRPWAVGLLADKPMSFSRTVFIVIMLASVTFDGLLATPLWADLSRWMILSEDLRPAVLALQGIAGNAVAAITLMSLLGFLLAFLALYLLFSAFMRWAAPQSERSMVSLPDLAGYFVLSLIPIALAYHLAHYLSYLLIAGQYIIPMSSDPFGFGWDIFGTRLYLVNIGIVDARFIWYVSVITIVIGHIIAVYLGHNMAERLFGSTRAARRSQIPMLFLMVGYTMISLWILAQPVIETG